MRVTEFRTDVGAAMAFASGLTEVDGSRLGVMGFCMGGQVSYLTAANRPNLPAVVAFYPGFVFNQLGSGEDPAPYDFTENIVSPILVLSGQDHTNPSSAQVETIDADLTQGVGGPRGAHVPRRGTRVHVRGRGELPRARGDRRLEAVFGMAG
jgi:dienelactone hydrolase